jgi:hypothetical protein
MKDLTSKFLIRNWKALQYEFDSIRMTKGKKRDLHVMKFYFGCQAYLKTYGFEFDYNKEPTPDMIKPQNNK